MGLFGGGNSKTNQNTTVTTSNDYSIDNSWRDNSAGSHNFTSTYTDDSDRRINNSRTNTDSNNFSSWLQNNTNQTTPEAWAFGEAALHDMGGLATGAIGAVANLAGVSVNAASDNLYGALRSNESVIGESLQSVNNAMAIAVNSANNSAANVSNLAASMSKPAGQEVSETAVKWAMGAAAVFALALAMGA